MPDATARLDEIRAEAEPAIAAAPDTAALEELRVRYLGRKSELTQVLRSIGELPPEQRGPVGGAANAVRVALEDQLAARARELDTAELDERLVRDRIDVTLPGDPPSPPGHLHLTTGTSRTAGACSPGLGFRVSAGPGGESA